MKEMKKDSECKIFFAFTANLVASGLRGVITDFVRKVGVDAVITTGGAIDHDLIKSHAPYVVGNFAADDAELHKRGINRIGNVFVPNERYELLEKLLQPKLKKMYEKKKIWGVSEFINETALLTKPSDKHSFLRACLDKKIPVFSPCLIDSAIGLQLYFFKQEYKDFVIDETADLPKLANIVLGAKRTGAVVLGGGPAKHFTIASNILRGGLDYGVYFTTASAFDGSLSGAHPSEAKSWGKISERGRTAVVYGDATINFALAASAVLGGSR
jgi:deoxyhypusine synthase